MCAWLTLLAPRKDRWGSALGWVRLGVSLVLLTGACQGQDIDPASGNVQPYPGTPISGYKLAWSDEFNAEALDASKWTYRTGTRHWSVQLPRNNVVSNGLYRILLKKETVGSSDYTAGGIISRKLFRYGYYETRMKVPPGAGWHTSFWMMKQNAGSDPVLLELDALENDSVNPHRYSVNVHRHRPLPHVALGNKRINTPSLADEFHVIGCEFTPARVNYFFDGTLVQTVDAALFPHANMNIWLTSIASSLGGTPAVDDSRLPAQALFDYARFFVLGPHAKVRIVSPATNGVALTDTNTSLYLAAELTLSTNGLSPLVSWHKVSGPGDVIFDNPAATNTAARFLASGNYVVECATVVGTATNAARLAVAVNAPVTSRLQDGVDGYNGPCTFIRGDEPDWNSGARDQIIVGRWGNEGLRSLLSFDLASLGPNASIQTAELDLWTLGGSSTVGPLELHRLTHGFVEGTGDGSSPANGAGTGATWMMRTQTAPWITAGGDYDPAILSSVAGYDAMPAGAQKTFGTSTRFVAAAQSAYDSSRPLNLIVLSPETEHGARNAISRIRSDDSRATRERPRLTLTYLGRYAPYVHPGSPRAILAGTATPLSGNVSNATAITWGKVSGPGAVTFSDARQVATTARFAVPGRYVLRLSASNTLARVSRDLTAVVADMRPQLSPTQVTPQSIGLQVHGTPGLPYVAESSTNLVDWEAVFTTNAVTMPFFWAVSPTEAPTRFYRVRLSP